MVLFSLSLVKGGHLHETFLVSGLSTIQQLHFASLHLLINHHYHTFFEKSAVVYNSIFIAFIVTLKSTDSA